MVEAREEGELTVVNDESIVVLQEKKKRRQDGSTIVLDSTVQSAGQDSLALPGSAGPFKHRYFQKNSQKPTKTTMKISTKILNRSISRQKDRSFNRSLLDYMRQRKKAKEKIFNTCRKSPRNHGSRFPSLHAPQKVICLIFLSREFISFIK